MMWDLLFGQKLCEPVPLTSEIHGDEKWREQFVNKKMVTYN
jgi:hypothetical protein